MSIVCVVGFGGFIGAVLKITISDFMSIKTSNKLPLLGLPLEVG